MNDHEIVITRDKMFRGSAVAYNVELDGAAVGTIKNGQTISIPAAVGTHSLSFSTKGKIEEMVSVTVEEDQFQLHLVASFNAFMKFSVSGNNVNKIEFENKQKAVEHEKSKDPKVEKERAFISKKMKFVSGLNLPQNIMCKVSCQKSKVVISASGQEFTLQTERLIDVSVMTNKDVQKQYVSSIGGAVAGAMLLGPFGAILGGSASQRNIKTKTQYLIFTYRDDEEQKFILFDVTDNLSDAKKIKDQFKYLKKNESVKIEL